MKKIVFLFLLTVGLLFDSYAQTYEYKIVTTVESIVPLGLGRSRIVEEKSSIDASNFTTERTDGKHSSQKNVKRKNAKVKEFAETKLLNFYSGVGINFQNIASNDALISSKINEVVEQGYELAFVTSGVESDSGEDDGKGIFITRYVFKRPKK